MSGDRARPRLDDPIPPTIGAPAVRALSHVGIHQYVDLVAWTTDGLEGLHGVGPTALDILQVGLAQRGSSFAPNQGA